MNKFWNFKNLSEGESELFLNGTISDTSWFEDDVTPEMFKNELASHTGNITVWINSPGGDVFAANQIYNMLKNHAGNITVKIDALAASAATIVAMAGDTVQISPVGMFMIHNPATMAYGDHKDMEQTISILNEVKENIINAYQTKTGLSHNKISQMMDDETWMNAKKAVQLGFADEIMYKKDNEEDVEEDETTEENSANEDEEPEIIKTDNKVAPLMFSANKSRSALIDKISAKTNGKSVQNYIERLNLIKENGGF